MAEEKYIEVGGRLHSIATGNVLAGANEVFDDDKGKKQSDINTETDAALEDRYTKGQTYSKSELNNMITTPNQEYVSVTATAQTTAVTDLLPTTGAADTVYRVGNWDGSQYDPSVYSEYAWNGSQYVHLSTKTQIGEVFDISAYHATGGTLATYADLSAALDSNNGGGVPQSLQKGGMSVKFVQSSDNKYVQARCMAQNFTTDVTQWQGVDDEPTAGSNNLITSDAVYNETKKSDVILAVDKTDLARGYYYDNTTGEKVANQNCLSKLMDIPTNTKEINVIWGGPDTTVAFFGIAIYDAPIAELTDENISDHFIKGFTCRDLLEVSRVVVNNSYKSIAVTIGNTFSSQVLFNALESCVHYGSRLLDVFYLNDNFARSMVGKSVYLRTLDKTTGIVSLRDLVTKADYNVQSTVKKGKELLLLKDTHYVYLGILVDWDIVDHNFSNISQTADNTFVLSTPKSAEGQKFFDMIYNKKYRQTGNTTVNGDGVVSEFDCVWEDGTVGHVAYNTFDDDVLEYRSSIVTYGVSYAVYYGLKTFDEYGNITSETGLEIRVI